MAQITVTSPLKSRLSSPFQAPLPTALKGRIADPIITTQNAAAFRNVAGVNDYDSAPSFMQYVFLPPGGGDYYAAGPVLAMKGFTNNVDLATRSWTKFAQCVDTYTDATTPANDYTGTSTIVGGGQCPQATGYPLTQSNVSAPAGEKFYPTPAYVVNAIIGDSPNSWDISSGVWKIDVSGGSAVRVISSPINASSYYTTLLADMLSLALGNSGNYLDAPFPSQNYVVTGLNPASYSGAFNPGGGAFTFHIPSTAATCGWEISVGGMAGDSIHIQREKGTLSTGRYYYWIGQWDDGLSNGLFNSGSTGEIITRVTFLSDGFISGGQSIGLSGDSPTIAMPFPTAPFPIQSMGTNAIFRSRTFAVIGQSPSFWIKRFFINMGNNY